MSHKNTTQNQHLEENKKQPSKEGNLGVKKGSQKKSIKGSDLKENRKDSPLAKRQGPLKGNGLPDTTPLKGRPKGPDLKENRKDSPLAKRQAPLKGKGLQDTTPLKGRPKGPDLKENRKDSPLAKQQGQLKGKELRDTRPLKGRPKGPDLKENKKDSPYQGPLKLLGLQDTKPLKDRPKGPDLKENKKDSLYQGPLKWLGGSKPTKGLDLQEIGKKATDQSKINGKELGDKNSAKGQSLQENRIRSRQQANLKGKGLAHQNSPKGQNFQENINPVSDPSSIVVKFTNLLMVDGKKTKSLSTLSKSLKLFKKYVEDLTLDDQIKQKDINTKKTQSTLNYLDQAVLNVKPSLEVRKKKISGIMRQIPAIPSSNRKETLGIRWIIESARKKKKKNYKPFHQCLAEELLDAFQSQGEPYKRKQALHKTAEGNRTYIRHRWW